VLAARALIEKDPSYSYVTARLLLDIMRIEIAGRREDPGRMESAMPSTSRGSSAKGIAASCSTSGSATYDLPRLGQALGVDNDLKFDYLGLQTLYDRYFLHIDERRIETAAGVLHARRDGPGAERDRPRGARDRVLQRAVVVRLHELDADAVQLRDPAQPAVRPAT
jgi:ribonucleotide reductase alpha subunit